MAFIDWFVVQEDVAMKWIRIFAWAALIFVSAILVGFAFGTGTTSTVGIFLSSSALYCLFVRPIQVRRFRHVIAAYLLVETIDWSVPLLLGATPSQLLDYWESSARHLAAALLGLAVANLLGTRRIGGKM